MTTTAVLPAPVASSKTKDKAQRRISWPAFQRQYLTKEDGFKYEWLNGFVAKTTAMDYSQFFIIRNLRDLFEQLRSLGKTEGLFLSEGDIFFAGQHRRPDVCFLTNEQVDRTAYGENQVPDFVVEVISTHDQVLNLHGKMEDYRKAGVKIVWHILPPNQEVHVYSGDDLRQMRVCKTTDICSAHPVLPKFELTVEAVFRKPPKPQ
jgi:Uma2 family endonuclease